MTFALIILGVAIGLAGSFSSGLGYFVIRKLHNRIVDDLMSTGDFDSSTFSISIFFQFFVFEKSLVIDKISLSSLRTVVESLEDTLLVKKEFENVFRCRFLYHIEYIS